MSWDAIGAVSEAFSALGLFLVLVQVRHAGAEMRRSISQSRSDAIRSSMALAMEPRVLSAEVKATAALGGHRPQFVQGLIQQTGLTEEEAQLLFYQWAIAWQANEQIIHSLNEATPGTRTAEDNAIRLFYQMRPVSRLWYQCMKATLNPDAVHYVDSVLARPA